MAAPARRLRAWRRRCVSAAPLPPGRRPLPARKISMLRRAGGISAAPRRQRSGRRRGAMAAAPGTDPAGWANLD